MDTSEQDSPIVLKTDTIERSNSGAITGTIYFDFTDYQFPEVGWNDFVIVIIGWWIKALRRLSEGLTTTESLKFMDGPLQVRLTAESNVFCALECIDNGTDSAVEYSKIISIDELLSDVMRVGSIVNNICKTNHWNSDDISLLNELVEN